MRLFFLLGSHRSNLTKASAQPPPGKQEKSSLPPPRVFVRDTCEGMVTGGMCCWYRHICRPTGWHRITPRVSVPDLSRYACAPSDEGSRVPVCKPTGRDRITRRVSVPDLSRYACALSAHQGLVGRQRGGPTSVSLCDLVSLGVDESDPPGGTENPRVRQFNSAPGH